MNEEGWPMVKKLILPVAGMGARLRPLTLSTPKALLPVAGKPLLEYILEEARASGIREVILVISPQHQAHFDKYLEGVVSTFHDLKFAVLTQENPFGNGEAILKAYDLIKNEPIAVRFCDDILIHDEPALKSLISLFNVYRAPIFALERLPKEIAHRYGVVAVEDIGASPVYKVTRLVEKPKPEENPEREIPSNLTVVGAFVFTPEIIEHLRVAEPNMPQVIDSLTWTAGVHKELMLGSKIYGWEFPGKRFDCGMLEGLQKAHEFLKNK